MHIERSNAFVNVVGNIEILVFPLSGTYNLSVSDVPAGARGGAVLLGTNADQSQALTDALRAGTTSFSFSL